MQEGGLPTYTQSRSAAAGLPGYNTTWDQPPTTYSPPVQQHSHFHFHMPASWPSLPVALHLRPAPASTEHQYPPDPAPSDLSQPPKYEDAPPAVEDPNTNQSAVMTETREESSSTAVNDVPYQEEFVHPEERRRREAEQEAARARGDPPL